MNLLRQQSNPKLCIIDNTLNPLGSIFSEIACFPSYYIYLIFVNLRWSIFFDNEPFFVFNFTSSSNPWIPTLNPNLCWQHYKQIDFDMSVSLVSMVEWFSMQELITLMFASDNLYIDFVHNHGRIFLLMVEFGTMTGLGFNVVYLLITVAKLQILYAFIVILVNNHIAYSCEETKPLWKCTCFVSMVMVIYVYICTSFFI